MTERTFAEAEIFNVAKGLDMPSTQARTLAYCLYWSQKASHMEGQYPVIWKTGREIGEALGLDNRTGNSHLKNLAERGFWTIHYAPRPYGISKVTWLTFTQRSLDLMALTQQLVETPKNKKGKQTIKGCVTTHPNVQKTNLQGSDTATSTQTNIKDKTSEKTESFLLSGQAGKNGKKEPCHPKTSTGGKTLKPPKYLTVGKATVDLANLISETWHEAGLKDWDWTSSFTWHQCDEVSTKFLKRDLPDLKDRKLYIDGILEHWSWMRICMEYRFSSHHTNVNRPSAMALAFEFDRLADRLVEKWSSKPLETSSSCFDEDF